MDARIDPDPDPLAGGQKRRRGGRTPVLARRFLSPQAMGRGENAAVTRLLPGCYPPTPGIPPQVAG